MPTLSSPPPTPTAARGAHDDRADTAFTRRALLRKAGLAGGTVLVLSAGGISYRAYDNGVLTAGDGGAYAAWEEWEAGSGPSALVSAAILAANPHDTQAWLFRITGSSIDLFADRARSLGSIDPFGRELVTGLGCALENLMQAAPANGYRATLRLTPTPSDPVHVARVSLAPGPRRRGALYRAIPDRHTARSAYAERPVAPAALAGMGALAAGLPGARVHWFDSQGDRARIGALMVAAARAVVADAQQSRDGFVWFRSSADEIQKRKDGLTLDAQGLSALTTAVAKLLPASSRSAGDRFWVDQTRKTQTRTAAAYGIVTVPDARDDAARLTGGRLLERIHLWTAANGLALQHMNQMTECADRELELGRPPRFGDALRTLIPEGGGEPLVAFRIGHAAGGEGRRRSPRRPAREVIA